MLSMNEFTRSKTYYKDCGRGVMCDGALASQPLELNPRIGLLFCFLYIFHFQYTALADV